MKQTKQHAAMNGTMASSQVVTGDERKEVLEQRKLLIDLQSQSSQAFDKMIVTLAGGALTVSIGFIRQTVPEALPGTTLWLGLAWLLLVLSLLASLFSHFASQMGLMRQCEELDQRYLGVHVPASSSHVPGRVYRWVNACMTRIFGARMTTHWLNVAAILCCVVGIGFLALFVVLNFGQLQMPLPK